jgi:hypothetical protein
MAHEDARFAQHRCHVDSQIDCGAWGALGTARWALDAAAIRRCDKDAVLVVQKARLQVGGALQVAPGVRCIGQIACVARAAFEDSRVRTSLDRATRDERHGEQRNQEYNDATRD